MKYGFRVVIVLAFGILLSLAACGGGGGGSSDNPPGPQPPAAPADPPSITIDGYTVTATWAAEQGKTYYVYYKNADFDDSTKTTATKVGPLTSSPATFTISYPTYWYFKMSVSEGGLESPLTSTYERVPVLPAPSIMNITENGESNTLTVSAGNGSVADSVRVYYGLSSNVTPTTGTLIGDTFVTGSVDHAMTAYFDVSGLPLEYYYIAQSVYLVGGSVKSASVPSSVRSSSPTLARFQIASTYGQQLYSGWNPQAADGGLLDVAGDTAYWICGGGKAFCRDAQVYYPNGAIGTSNYITSLAVEPDGSRVYLLYDKNAGLYSTGTGSNFTFLTLTEKAVGIAQDADKLYINTDTSIVKVAKADISGGVTLKTDLATGLSGVRAMIVAGTRLFYADSNGISYLDLSAPGAPVLVTTDATVVSIAVDGATVYFIADSASVHNARSIYKVDAGGGAVTLVQDRLYNARQLTVQGTDLAWIDQSKLYAVPSAGGAVQCRVGEKVAALAFDSGGYLYAAREAGYVYHIPPAYSFPVLQTPAAMGSVTVSAKDSALQASWSYADGADNYEVYYDSSYVASTSISYETTTGLVNGTVYTVEVVPANIVGTGAGASSQGSPQIGAPTNLTAAPGDGKVSLTLYQYNPSTRDVKFNIYRSAAPTVDTSGAPVSSVTVTSLAQGTRAVTIDDAVANGTIYYYNATAEDVGLVNNTTSAPAVASGAEPYSNGAPSMTLIVTSGGPTYDAPYYNYTAKNSIAYAAGNPGSTLYWLSWQTSSGKKYDGTTTGAAFASLNGWSDLTGTDDAFAPDLYGGAFDTLYGVTGLASSPATATILTNAAYPDLYQISSVVYADDGADKWLIASNGRTIIKVKTTDANTGNTAAMVRDTGSVNSPIGALAIAGTTLYWTEYQSSSTTVWKADLTGGSATSLFSVSGQIMDLAASATRLYWVVYNNSAYTVQYVSLAGGNIITIDSGYAVVFDPLHNRVYWDNGAIYKLDAQGRRFAHLVKADPGVRGLSIPDRVNGKIYSFGYSSNYASGIIQEGTVDTTIN